MGALQRDELIRPILNGEKIKRSTQRNWCSNSGVAPLLGTPSRGHNFNIEIPADKFHAPHSYPHWFTEEQKDKVVLHKVQNPPKKHSPNCPRP